jgi:hypothetical protein
MAGRMELQNLLLNDAATRLKCSEEHILRLGAEGKVELLAHISDCPLERGGSWSGKVTLTTNDCARLAKRRDKFAWISEIQDGDEVLAVPFEHQRAIINREDVLVPANHLQSLGDEELSDRARAGYELTIAHLVGLICDSNVGRRFCNDDGSPKASAIAEALYTRSGGALGMGFSTVRKRLSHCCFTLKPVDLE